MCIRLLLAHSANLNLIFDHRHVDNIHKERAAHTGLKARDVDIRRERPKKEVENFIFPSLSSKQINKIPKLNSDTDDVIVYMLNTWIYEKTKSAKC